MKQHPTDREARQDIAELLVRYATGIDRKDWPLFRSCFTEDCHADYGDIGVWDGVDAIADFMARTHPSPIRSLHRISNIAISGVEDGVRARSYVDLLYATDAGGGTRAAGYYDDELVHTEDGWKIARRRYTMVQLSPLEKS